MTAPRRVGYSHVSARWQNLRNRPPQLHHACSETTSLRLEVVGSIDIGPLMARSTDRLAIALPPAEAPGHGRWNQSTTRFPPTRLSADTASVKELLLSVQGPPPIHHWKGRRCVSSVSVAPNMGYRIGAPRPAKAATYDVPFVLRRLRPDVKGSPFA